MSKCLFCETDVAQKDGKRARLFCNGNCRNKYYYKINAANKPKKKAGRPKKDATLNVFSEQAVKEIMGATTKDQKSMKFVINEDKKKYPEILGMYIPKSDNQDIQAEIDKHKADLAYLTKISSPTTLTKKSIAFAERKIAELTKIKDSI